MLDSFLPEKIDLLDGELAEIGKEPLSLQTIIDSAEGVRMHYTKKPYGGSVNEPVKTLLAEFFKNENMSKRCSGSPELETHEISDVLTRFSEILSENYECCVEITNIFKELPKDKSQMSWNEYRQICSYILITDILEEQVKDHLEKQNEDDAQIISEIKMKLKTDKVDAGISLGTVIATLELQIATEENLPAFAPYSPDLLERFSAASMCLDGLGYTESKIPAFRKYIEELKIRYDSQQKKIEETKGIEFKQDLYRCLWKPRETTKELK